MPPKKLNLSDLPNDPWDVVAVKVQAEIDKQTVIEKQKFFDSLKQFVEKKAADFRAAMFVSDN